jgi:hypothetical protein
MNQFNLPLLPEGEGGLRTSEGRMRGYEVNSNQAIEGFSPEQMKIAEIFHPYSLNETRKAINSNQRFVHYTSADTAIKIIKNEEVWMRNSFCMNDFLELQYGYDCLLFSTEKHKAELVRFCNRVSPTLWPDLVNTFNSLAPRLKSDTFITSFSMHNVEEDTLGRLSMWRAYGGSNGVALVVNGGPFLRPNDALNAYTSPVVYFDRSQFDVEFGSFIKRLDENADFLKQCGEDNVFEYIFNTFRYAILCTKHPGFKEEKEWRVIYDHKLNPSNIIKTETETVHGVPQHIAKIPLKDQKDKGLYGVEILSLIERVIIGPTSYPHVIRDALVAELVKARMADAEKRVVISDIPLRT